MISTKPLFEWISMILVVFVVVIPRICGEVTLLTPSILNKLINFTLLKSSEVSLSDS